MAGAEFAMSVVSVFMEDNDDLQMTSFGGCMDEVVDTEETLAVV